MIVLRFGAYGTNGAGGSIEDSRSLPPDVRLAIRDLTQARRCPPRTFAGTAGQRQLKALLLRHGVRFGKCSWTAAHERAAGGRRADGVARY
jgi:hypothetical protein